MLLPPFTKMVACGALIAACLAPALVGAQTPALTAAPTATAPAVTPVVPTSLVPPPAPAAVPVLPGATPPAAAGLDPNLPASATPAAPGAAAVATAPAAKPKPKAPPAPPRETALPTTTTPTFTADTVYMTARAAERYAKIADAGGWEAMSPGLRPGARGKGVSALRHRLTIEGDLDASQEGDPPFNEEWDAQLTAAVKHFQERMGLKPTGVVAGATLKAMNVPASVRFRQLASSAQRIAGSNFAFGDRYVVVNIPSASVEAIEKGKVVHRYVAVVGDIDHRSPEETARIQAVNLNPTWTVPTSIIKNEIIPHMRKDPSYLARAKIRMLDGRGNEVDPRSIDWNSEKAVNYILRQDSGAQNSLGSIRINMPNKDAVYMHDTPSKRFFANDYRFLSHGCVRVEGVYDLAAWLLEGTMNTESGVWDKAALLQGVAAKERVDVKLAKSVPVAWVYLTGWADADGAVHFRDDVYSVDSVGSEVAATPAPAVSAQR